MSKLTTAAIFFLALGILTSVTILSGYQVLFAIPLIYYSYLAVKNQEIDLPKSAIFLGAFALVALLSLTINFELIPKPGKNFGRLKYYFFGLGGIFVFRHWLRNISEKLKNILSNVFLFTVILAGAFVTYDYFSHVQPYRARGFTDTMRYGYGSGMFLLVLISAIIHHAKLRTWFNWKIASLAFIIGFVGMYLTYTRGALLGFISGLPFVLYFYRPKLGLLFSGLALGLALVLFYFYQYGDVRQFQGSRFLMTKANHGDVIRRSQWAAAVIAVKEKPLLGWGLSNFHSQLKRIKHQYDLDAKDYDDAHAHNLFLEIASGTGLIGLLLFLAWLISWAIESFNKGGVVRNLVIPFGVAFVVSGQFEVTLDANNASMIFFVYALSSAIKDSHVEQI